MSGEIEVNEPVRVYDTSGPWGDPDFHGDVTQGLPPLRAKWIRDRGDVEEYEGRNVQPIDDGYLSEAHAAHASRKRPTSNAQRSTPNGQKGSLSTFNSQPSTAAQRRPFRARAGRCVTQLAYARQGIITPEMEFIAIRENGRTRESESRESTVRSQRFTIHEATNSRNSLALSPSPVPNHIGNWRSAIAQSRDHSRIRPRRSRARPRHHPREHQSSRIRADDHRPQFPGEDQRQHRQQRRRVVDRGRSRENALGHQVGRRHRDGSFAPARTFTPRANGSFATRPCPSAPCRFIRRSRKSAATPKN